MANEDNKHIDETAFNVPFVCRCHHLGEALCHIREGNAMLQTKGEAGTEGFMVGVKVIILFKSNTSFFRTLSLCCFLEFMII